MIITLFWIWLLLLIVLPAWIKVQRGPLGEVHSLLIVVEYSYADSNLIKDGLRLNMCRLYELRMVKVDMNLAYHSNKQAEVISFLLQFGEGCNKDNSF